jgi:hypothetical protein
VLTHSLRSSLSVGIHCFALDIAAVSNTGLCKGSYCLRRLHIAKYCDASVAPSVCGLKVLAPSACGLTLLKKPADRRPCAQQQPARNLATFQRCL